MSTTITEAALDVTEFDRRTDERWRGEHLEFLACSHCGFIALGIRDCHVALSDPHDLNRQFAYNLPRKTSCPSCGVLWYDYGKLDARWQTREVTFEDLSHSDWRWILREKI